MPMRRLVRAAIGARKAIFCEKPLAHDLADTIAVAAEVEAAGLPFQLGFQRRFDPGYTEARRLLSSGELGTLYAFRLAGHDPAPPHEAYIPASGGLFRDFSIHDFDVIRWLTGQEVAEVYATGAVRGFQVFAKYGDVDTAVATLTMADGALGVLTVARHDPLGYDIRAELFGSRDSVSVGLGPRTPMRSVEPGVHAAGRTGVARLHRPLQCRVPGRDHRVRPRRRRGVQLAVHRPGRGRGAPHLGGRDPQPRRASAHRPRGDPSLMKVLPVADRPFFGPTCALPSAHRKEVPSAGRRADGAA